MNNSQKRCTSVLDAVILAGGKSERLRGIIPPYHKPFLVINGRALIVSAVEEATNVGAERIIVVATGENALPIWQLVGHLPRVRVMLNAGGPGEAVHAGLELCVNDRVLVLMSDNVHGEDDVQRVCDEEYAIGVREYPVTEAQRFTRIVDGRWVERPTPYVDDGTPTTVWCGPLVIDRQCGLHALDGCEKIGPHLEALFPSHSDAPKRQLVSVKSFDVGIPDVVKQITWK